MLGRTGALVGSLVMLVAGPGMVVGLVPWWITGWRLGPTPGFTAARWLGIALAVAGAVVVLDSFARFVLRGLGTPAPILPPRRLVVTGLYRRVRNPMYVAVLAMVLGQALLFGSPLLGGYALALAVTFHLFVVGYEEPRLLRTFGAEYEAFRANVPRWLPRLRPWTDASR